MTIRYAILGFLSWRPCSGYDLKKMIAGSTFFYWSGSNNQIYRTLVQLHQEGLVAQRVERQENYPDRKVYTLTDEGQAALKAWVRSSPELPQLRNAFLIQLAWADQLAPGELDALLEAYEGEVHAQWRMCQEEARRKQIDPARTPREAYLWHMMFQNWSAFYEHELAWIRSLRQGLGDKRSAYLPEGSDDVGDAQHLRESTFPAQGAENLQEGGPACQSQKGDTQ